MRWFRFCLWKAYFEKGYALTSYLKYLIVLFGLFEGFAGRQLYLTLALGIMYGLGCFLIGWVWYHYHIIDAEHEVQNTVNPFVKEMRKTYKRKI